MLENKATREAIIADYKKRIDSLGKSIDSLREDLKDLMLIHEIGEAVRGDNFKSRESIQAGINNYENELKRVEGERDTVNSNLSARVTDNRKAAFFNGSEETLQVDMSHITQGALPKEAAALSEMLSEGTTEQRGQGENVSLLIDHEPYIRFSLIKRDRGTLERTDIRMTAGEIVVTKNNQDTTIKRDTNEAYLETVKQLVFSREADINQGADNPNGQVKPNQQRLFTF